MKPLRIGIQIDLNDSFWVQVDEVIYHAAGSLGEFEAVPIEINDPLTANLLDENQGLVDELVASNLQALICKDILPLQLKMILDQRLPIIYLAESDILHPLFASPKGLYDAAHLVSRYLAKEMKGAGHILCVGGLIEYGADDGSSRLAGFQDGLKAYPDITYTHIPTNWDYQAARNEIGQGIQGLDVPIHAIFGLSDTLALAARDIAAERGLLNSSVVIGGINGDPLALAAIVDRTMAVTVETPASELGFKAISLALQAARGTTIPAHFHYEPSLITAENVNEIALRKLISIADIPSRIVGVNRRQEQNRLVQLETSAEINRHVGSLMDKSTLLAEVAHLIRITYNYDEVQVFLWSEPDQCYALALPSSSSVAYRTISTDTQDILGEAIRSREPIFVPDAQASYRFPPDLLWPKTRSRVVLPILLGDYLLGILDLHSNKPAIHERHELIGLHSLANQLGVVIKNAELYAEAVDARARAERADQLKTRLLANVSHELRTPLNVIIGYSQTALAEPNPYKLDLPTAFRRHLEYIAQSGQHLLRLINDLLSLSQVEIGSLELYKEAIQTKLFLEGVFESLAQLSDDRNVVWRLNLPEDLPMIEADSIRFRQILINLLHNASKFTSEGSIELGAEVMPPYLHLWISDTGIGIPIEMQERIFDPFTKTHQQEQSLIGVGLGLTIARQLVTLHGGSITLESQPNCGSTFHIYLPLPDAEGSGIVSLPENSEPVLLYISSEQIVPPAIGELSERQHLELHHVGPNDDLNQIMSVIQPVALAWDLTVGDLEEWQIFERIRKNPRLCHLPLIIYTQNHGLAEGMTNILMKPVSEKTLVSTLLSLFPKNQAQPILIVDDDSDARSLYQRLIEQALPNYPIIQAQNGVDALKSLEKETPGLVILDLMMPEVDGFTVLEQMRAIPATRNIPVIVMSGRLLSTEDVRRLDYGNVIFHTKHLLTEEEAVAAIQQALDDPKGLSKATSRLVKQAFAYLHQNYKNPSLDRTDVSSEIGVSPKHLDRIFGKEVGLSVIECLNRIRIRRAKELLTTTDNTVMSIAMQVGYNDSSYFSRVFSKVVGQSPSDFRKIPKP